MHVREIGDDHNFIEDASKLKKKIYLLGYNNQTEVDLLNGKFLKFGINITNVILTEGETLNRRSATSIKNLQKNNIGIIKLDNVEDGSIILGKNIEDLRRINECTLGGNRTALGYTEKSIKDVAIINNKYRVVDPPSFYKKWPWYFDVIYQHIGDRKNFIEEFPFVRGSFSNGLYVQMKEYEGRYVKIRDGKRIAQKEGDFKNKRKLIILGDSRIYGDGLCDEDTIPYRLQTVLNDYCVENHALPAQTPEHCLNKLQHLDIPSNAVIVCSSIQGYYGMKDETTTGSTAMRAEHLFMSISRMHKWCEAHGHEFVFFHLGWLINVKNMTMIEQFIAECENVSYRKDEFWDYIDERIKDTGVPIYDLRYLFDTKQRKSFFYNAWHFSPEGAKIIAEEMGKIILRRINGVSEDILSVVERNILSISDYIKQQIVKGANTPEIDKYIELLKREKIESVDDVGCIVMNANPFTLGHLHLVEYALKHCECLYIFVVEEDRSYFSFYDRFQMVKKAVDKFPNVKVLPSGKFIISAMTFPGYFVKEEDQNAQVDTSSDLIMFSLKIVPVLGIKKRFVGKEPNDKITEQYNKKMKEVLPQYGVQVEEISRACDEDGVISASRVRSAIKNKEYDKLTSLLPQTTIDYIMSKGL